MARRATSLGPTPSLFVFLLFFVYFFVIFPPFLSLFLIEKPVFSLKGHFLFIFECLPLFLLGLFWPPPFLVSLYLSLFFSLLPSFLFIFFFWGGGSFFCLYFRFFFAFVHEKNNINIFNSKVFLSIVFFGFLSCFSLSLFFS